MRYLILVLLFAGCGCGALVQKKKEVHQTSHLTEAAKAVSDSHLQTSYPSPSSTVITISGNSSPHISVGGAGKMVKLTQGEKKTSTESAESDFSMDEFISSVPVWLWPVMGFIGLIGFGLYLYWSKTSVAGKVFDEGLAGGIKFGGEMAKSLNRKLNDLSDKSSEAKAYRAILDEINDKDRELQSETRGKGKR